MGLIERTTAFGCPPVGGLNPIFLPYKPVALLTPFSRVDLASFKQLSFSADAKVENDYFEFPGVNGYIEFGTASAGLLHTLFIDCVLDTFPTSYPFVCCYKRTGQSNNWELFFSDNASYSNIGHGYASASASTKFAFASPAGKRLRIAVQVTSTSGGTSVAWANGTQLAASSGGSLGASSGNNRLGQQSDSTSLDWDGRVWSVAIFDSLVPASLCQRWTADPTILWARRVALPLSIDVAGTLPTLSSATYVPGSITSTGFRPSVTAS